MTTKILAETIGRLELSMLVMGQAVCEKGQWASEKCLNWSSLTGN